MPAPAGWKEFDKILRRKLPPVPTPIFADEQKKRRDVKTVNGYFPPPVMSPLRRQRDGPRFLPRKLHTRNEIKRLIDNKNKEWEGESIRLLNQANNVA